LPGIGSETGEPAGFGARPSTRTARRTTCRNRVGGARGGAGRIGRRHAGLTLVHTATLADDAEARLRAALGQPADAVLFGIVLIALGFRLRSMRDDAGVAVARRGQGGTRPAG
jgi:hypothetical protein